MVDILVKNSSDSKEKIISMTYETLEQVYSTTLSRLKKIYSRLKDFDVKDIRNLLYHGDGKTIDDRIAEYLRTGTSILSVLYKLESLITNESRIIKRNIIENRVKPIASVLIIECEEENCRLGCNQYAGEYPADEPIELPPYHPNCNCTYCFIETDNEDDMVDLDLEVEEQ